MKPFAFIALLSLILSLPSLRAETMPDRPDPDLIIQNMRLGSFTLPSKLIQLAYPMSASPQAGMNLKSNEIAITIDDGPTEHTPEVLRTLREHGVKAVFFLVGHNIKQHPEMVIQILREGHSVGNHTYDHPDMTKLSVDAARKQIDDTKYILEKVVADENARHPELPQLKLQPFFRFPEGAGASNSGLQQIVREFGYANFMWRMSVHDSRTRDPNIELTVAVKNMLDVYHGGIMLLHETHPWTREMLPYFLQILSQRHYTTVYYQAAPWHP